MRVNYFFFSSRRRHTRCSRDWSSDVCSSDLELDAARRAQPPLAMVGAAAMPARRGEAEFGRGSAEMAGEHEACQSMGNEIACAILVAAEPRPATALVRVEQRQQLAMPRGGARPPDLAFARPQGRNRH